MNKKIKELEKEIMGLKQIIEQLELSRDKAVNLNEDLYPAITDMKITKGWYGTGTVTFDVSMSVQAEDLHRLINVLTHRTLTHNKYLHIIEQYKKQQTKD